MSTLCACFPHLKHTKSLHSLLSFPFVFPVVLPWQKANVWTLFSKGVYSRSDPYRTVLPRSIVMRYTAVFVLTFFSLTRLRSSSAQTVTSSHLCFVSLYPSLFERSLPQCFIGLYLLCIYSIAYFFALCNWQLARNSQHFFVEKAEI